MAVGSCGGEGEDGFGVEVVDEGDEDRFGGRWDFGGAVFWAFVVGDDDVLEDHEGAGGHSCAGFEHHLLAFVVEHYCAFDEVAYEFASVGVAEAFVVEEFAGFA